MILGNQTASSFPVSEPFRFQGVSNFQWENRKPLPRFHFCFLWFPVSTPAHRKQETKPLLVSLSPRSRAVDSLVMSHVATSKIGSVARCDVMAVLDKRAAVVLRSRHARIWTMAQKRVGALDRFTWVRCNRSLPVGLQLRVWKGAKNQRGKVLRLIQIRLMTASFDNNRVNCQTKSLQVRIADSSSTTQSAFHPRVQRAAGHRRGAHQQPDRSPASMIPLPKCRMFRHNSAAMTSSKRGGDLIFDALPFGRLWYAELNAVSDASA